MFPSKSGAQNYSRQTRDIVYITAEAVVGLLTVVVNGLVLMALWRYPILRTVTNCYIGSLAVADVLVGLLVAPLVIIVYFGLPRHFLGCVFVNSLVGVFVTISILSIVGVAFDRYWAILHPVARLNVATKRGALKMVAALWTLGTVIGLVPLMGWHNDPEGFDTCSYRRVIALKYSVYFKLFGFKIPILLTVLYLHVNIYYAMKRAEMNRNIPFAGKQSGCSGEKTSPGLNVHVFKSMVMIFTFFAICWIPIGIMSCIQLWSPETPTSGNLVIFLVVLSHFNSTINPILYVINQPGFRRVIGLYLPIRAVGITTSKGGRTSVIVERNAVAAFRSGLGETDTSLRQAERTTKETELVTHDKEPVQDVEPITNDNELV